MKKTKIIFLLSAIIMLCFLLTACDSKTPATPSATPGQSSTAIPAISQEYDTAKIWDGSASDSFSKGDGSETSPFEISSPEELAYLAKEVNAGNEYTGKYFSLVCDIDLDNREWTPIGNGIHAFMGNFEGNGHTVKNLKISQSIHYTYEYPTGREAAYCDSGLFATVQDASIQHVIIDGATISISDTKSGDTHSVGVLCGTVRTYQSASVISNIKIKNATITTDFSTNQSPLSLSIGGAIGHIYAYNNTTTTISLIETDSALSLTDYLSSHNYMGAVLGVAGIMDATFTLENCAAYQTLMPNPYQYYFGASDDFCGAIGCAQASAQPFTVKNVFSELTINKPVLESNKYFDSEIIAHAIIGDAYYYGLKDDSNAVGYIFENIFGCVEQVNTETGEVTTFTELYKLPEGTAFAQTNCQGCEKLPENHGFDEKIWDLSDLSRPVLK